MKQRKSAPASKSRTSPKPSYAKKPIRKAPPVQTQRKSSASGIRINKYLADHGFSTRKGADALIERGIVTINGKAAVLGDRVRPSDSVAVENAGTEHKDAVYFAYYKKEGVETLKSTAKGKGILETTTFPVRVFPVGRLDKDSEGLIIMTNDGRITNRLLSPSSDHEKEYSVKVNKAVTDMFLRRLRDGVRIGENETTKKAQARKTGKDSFDIAITEGKNRQIRRMCAAFGYDVQRLKRFRIMNITLGSLTPGTFRKIEGKELAAFMQSLGLHE